MSRAYSIFFLSAVRLCLSDNMEPTFPRWTSAWRTLRERVSLRENSEQGQEARFRPQPTAMAGRICPTAQYPPIERHFRHSLPVRLLDGRGCFRLQVQHRAIRV